MIHSKFNILFLSTCYTDVNLLVDKQESFQNEIPPFKAISLVEFIAFGLHIILNSLHLLFAKAMILKVFDHLLLKTSLFRVPLLFFFLNVAVLMLWSVETSDSCFRKKDLQKNILKLLHFYCFCNEKYCRLN